MRPLRSKAVQAMLSRLLAGWLWLCHRTARWSVDNPEAVAEVRAAGQGVIICFWHSRISLATAAWSNREPGPEVRALISLSPDGEFITRAAAMLGFPAIRGSSSKKSAPDKAKGGAAAFRDGLRQLRAGGGLALTPDGPRGPAEQMAEGAVMLARATGAPVLLLGAASRPCLTLGTWDRAKLPLPFSRAVVVWDGPIRLERDADVEAVRAEWTARLTAATRRAEASL